MIKNVCFIGREAFESHLNLSKDVESIAISITDPNAALARAPKGLTGLLRLSFEDDSEEMYGIEVGALPELHPEAENGVRLFFDQDELCDGVDAVRIVDFLKTYADKPEAYELYVHCKAGISRSSAVALFASQRYACEIEQANPDTSGANKRLLRLLNKAANGEKFTRGTMALQESAEPSRALLVMLDGVKTLVTVDPPKKSATSVRDLRGW